ncbi:MAG: hypothetical protein ACLQJL_09660 [Roseiarcus sp.]
MSVAAARPAPPLAAARSGSPLHSVPLLCAIGLVFTLAISWPSAMEVWRTGAFANTDDAMRLVEVRDWLAGQAWFDLHQYRLDPPAGVPMHWTRVLDLPLGLLVRLFAAFLPVEQAERLTRIVFPLALHLALFAAVAVTARRLAGPVAMLPAVAIAALSGGVLVQFQPGRIHHHSAQIVLAVLILWATVSALEARKFWPAAGAAALAALSLSINIEDLTYILVEIAAFALAFVALGERFRAAFFGFAVSLALSSLLAFVATVGPSRYFVGACDAFSTAHLFAIFLGAGVFCALAALSPILPGPASRLIGCACGGAVVLAAMALVYPACLHDPQAAVDPLLRRLWLDNVEEARPLASVVAAHPLKFVTLALAVVLGFAGALAAAWRETGPARVRWLVVGAFAAIGLVTSLWQVRALSSASAVALFGGAWIVARGVEWSAKRPGVLAALVPFALGLPFCSLFWAIVTPAQPQSNAVEGRVTCRAPATVAALGALPTSVLMAPIDMGSDILADTRHAVLAGPYHRNNHGNRELVDAMMADPVAARRIVRDSGAAYVVFCPAMPELALYAAASPDSLATALLAGKAPDWLIPQPIAGSPYRIYKVR